MHDNSALVRTRISQFALHRILPALYRETAPLMVRAWEVPDEPVPFAHARGQQYADFAIGQPWGKPWGTTWFHVTGKVPAEWAQPDTRAEMCVDLGFAPAQAGFQAEGLVYDPAGRIVKAIEPFNTHVPVPASGIVDFYIEAASNPDVAGGSYIHPTPLGDKSTAGTQPIYRLRSVDLALLDEEVW